MRPCSKTSFTHLPGDLLRGCAPTHTGVHTHSCTQTHSHMCTHMHTHTHMHAFAASALEEMQEVLLNDFPLQNVKRLLEWCF